MRDYSRYAGKSGGKGVHMSNAPNSCPVFSPEVARDAKLLNDAYCTYRDRYMKQNAAAHAKGEELSSRTVGVWYWLRSYVRAYNRKPNRLSDKTRKFCLGVLKIDELPVIEEFIPVGLRELPKRPPIRRMHE